MTDTAELEELSRQIKKTIEENKKFLERFMVDDFEPEEEEPVEPTEEV